MYIDVIVFLSTCRIIIKRTSKLILAIAMSKKSDWSLLKNFETCLRGKRNHWRSFRWEKKLCLGNLLRDFFEGLRDRMLIITRGKVLRNRIGMRLSISKRGVSVLPRLLVILVIREFQKSFSLLKLLLRQSR
jgi:hypothetical protein